MSIAEQCHRLDTERLALLRDHQVAHRMGDTVTAERLRRALNRNTERRNELLSAMSAQRRK